MKHNESMIHHAWAWQRERWAYTERTGVFHKDCIWTTVRAGVAGTEDFLLRCPVWALGAKTWGILCSDLRWAFCVFQVAGDYKYHPECFVCLSCRVVIEDQDTYALVERTKLYWWVTSHFSTLNFTCINLHTPAPDCPNDSSALIL